MSTETAHHIPGRLIYGCMGLGGDWSDSPYGPSDVEHAAAAVEAALAIGITVFDHADIYRSGKSEAVFGEVLEQTPGLRERIHIQTKCGIRLGEQALQAHYDLSRSAIIQQVNISLERLRTDYVDTLLLHRPDPLMEPEDIASAFAELRAEGKVRQLGVSNMSGSQIAFLQEYLDTPIVANQLEMSLLKRDWLETGVLVNHPDAVGYSFPEGTLEYCRSKSVALQAWGSLARGRYSGAGAEDASPAESATSELVAALARAKGTTPEAIVLAWLMMHPARIHPVIGTSDPGRIRACRDAEQQAALMTRAEWYSLWSSARGNTVP